MSGRSGEIRCANTTWAGNRVRLLLVGHQINMGFVGEKLKVYLLKFTIINTVKASVQISLTRIKNKKKIDNAIHKKQK
jgi:hypothetical protein